MAQSEISTVKVHPRYANFKQFSGAAIASCRCQARLSQLRLDTTQRPVDYSHVDGIFKDMKKLGVDKARVINAYIDVLDGGTSASRDQIEGLFEHMNSLSKPNGGDDITIGILPDHIRLRVTNGQHRLFAYCKYLVDRWDQIENKRPPLDPPPAPTDCLFAEALIKSAAEILAQDDAYWFVNVEYIPEPQTEKSRQMMSVFLADVNTVENTKVNSVIRQACLSIGPEQESTPRAYRWLGSQSTPPVILERLSMFPFLHTDKVVPEKRFEEMGYAKHQSLCVLALSECILHLEHISKTLAIPPSKFEVRYMWKRANPIPSSPIQFEDLGIYMTTRMDQISTEAWELTLKRPIGKSLFTGEHNWADGSSCWTLASVFDLKGWFFSKVDLAVVFMYWTIFFLFDKNIDSLASGKRGFDVYRRLAKCLDSCKELRNGILARIWTITGQTLQGGVTVKNLQDFSLTPQKKFISPSKSYIEAMASGFKGPSVDMKFAKSLALIVDKKDGYLGKRYGWKDGALSKYDPEPEDEDEVPLTPQQRAPKGKGRATPGPGHKTTSRKATAGNGQLALSPPLELDTTTQRMTRKGKERANAQLKQKERPRRSLSDEDQPESPPPLELDTTTQRTTRKGKERADTQLQQKGRPRRSILDEDQPESPHPLELDTSTQHTTRKGKERANPQLKRKERPRRSLLGEDQPASPPPPLSDAELEARRLKRPRTGPKVVDKMPPLEPPHSDSGDGVGKVVQETGEERDGGGTVKPAPDLPPSQKYWKGFFGEMEHKKGKEYASVEEWLEDVVKEARSYANTLSSV